MILVLVMIPFGLWLLLGSLSPPVDFDVREYHLQGPKEWYGLGRIGFLDHNVYTSFPFHTEMISLSAMVYHQDWWAGALAGKLVLALMAPLTSLSVFCLARRIFGTTTGLTAALIHLTTPWTTRISVIAYAEGSLTFFLTTGCLFALLATAVRETTDRRRLCLVGGLLAGGAMACKYTGLVSAVVPLFLLIVGRVWRQGAPSTATTSSAERQHDTPPMNSCRRLPETVLCGGIFLMAALMAVGPWLLRNVADTGNPVYPLAWHVFGGHQWSDAADARWKPAHSPSEHNIRQIPSHVLDFAVRNDWTSGLLFSLSIPALLLWRRRAEFRAVLLLTAWQFITWWALTHRIDRFWIPAIPLVAVAAAAAIELRPRGCWRWYVGGVVALCTLFNIVLCGIPRLIGFRGDLMDLTVAREEAIRPDLRRLNRSLPPTSRVLMVGEAEVFDCTFPLVYNTVFDDNLFELWTAGQGESGQRNRPLRPAAEILQTLRDHGITHVYVNWNEILRYRRPGSYGFTQFVQPARFDELVASGVLSPPQTLEEIRRDALPADSRAVVAEWDGSHVPQPSADGAPESAATEPPAGTVDSLRDRSHDQFPLIQLFEVRSRTQ